MTASWWLKFKRAQRHMVEIRKATRAYAKSQPYTISRVREPKGQNNVWRYRLDLDPPDPMIVAMLGDFIHNLHSALDHVVVACAPKEFERRVSFPLMTKDAFALDERGDFRDLDKGARESYLGAIRGLSFPVRAMIAEVQPHRRDPNTDIFGMLGRLENADKHRKLIATGASLRGGEITPLIRGQAASTHKLRRNEFFYDGAQVFSFTVVNPDLTDAEVDVRCSGTATISIKMRDVEGQERPLDFGLTPMMLRALRDIRFVLRQFSKHAIRQ